MTRLAFDELISQYKSCAKVHYDIDYANRSSVIRANKAVDKMIKISKTI